MTACPHSTTIGTDAHPQRLACQLDSHHPGPHQSGTVEWSDPFHSLTPRAPAYWCPTCRPTETR